MRSVDANDWAAYLLTYVQQSTLGDTIRFFPFSSYSNYQLYWGFVTACRSLVLFVLALQWVFSDRKIAQKQEWGPLGCVLIALGAIQITFIPLWNPDVSKVMLEDSTIQFLLDWSFGWVTLCWGWLWVVEYAYPLKKKRLYTAILLLWWLWGRDKYWLLFTFLEAQTAYACAMLFSTSLFFTGAFILVEADSLFVITGFVLSGVVTWITQQPHEEVPYTTPADDRNPWRGYVWILLGVLILSSFFLCFFALRTLTQVSWRMYKAYRATKSSPSSSKSVSSTYAQVPATEDVDEGPILRSPPSPSAALLSATRNRNIV